MPRIETILVPVDFSERSDAAAEHAAAWARLWDAKLIFAHFVPPSPYEYAAFDEGFYAAAAWPGLEEVRAPIEKRMDELIGRIQPGRPVERVIERGEPAHEIEALIRRRNVDLAVMPTHGYGPFRRFVLGSVVNKVLHDVTIPVLTGAHVEEIRRVGVSPYKRIAFAVDLREGSEEVVEWAQELARLCRAELAAIHAAPRIEVGGTYGTWAPAGARDEVVANARAELEKLLARTGCQADIHVASADAAEYIAETAEKVGADVLVIGRRGKDERPGVLSRAREHAYAILRRAPCAVLSV